MAVSETLAVYPTIENLCDPIKGRPKSSCKDDIKKLYHCPIETCKYYKTDCYFEKMKFLRQHFDKVHKTKSFSCDKCGKQFSLESALNRHKPVCGVSYQCFCGAKYQAYEALMTHVKRKHHEDVSLNHRIMMKLLQVRSTAQNLQKSVDQTVKVNAIIIQDSLKQKVLRLRENKTKDASSKATQTGMKMYRILPNIDIETSNNKEQTTKTVSLQTTLEGLSRKRKRSKTVGNVGKSSSSKPEVSFSTSGTQTTPIKDDRVKFSRFDSLTKISKISYNCEQQCNHSSNYYPSSTMDDANSISSIFEQNITPPVSEEKQAIPDNRNFDVMPCFEDTVKPTNDQNSSIESFMNDLLGTDTDFIMCADSETQTAFEDYFDNSFMDTYTQTCDSLLSDLDFADIETQTSWSLFDDANVDDVTKIDLT